MGSPRKGVALDDDPQISNTSTPTTAITKRQSVASAVRGNRRNSNQRVYERQINLDEKSTSTSSPDEHRQEQSRHRLLRRRGRSKSSPSSNSSPSSSVSSKNNVVRRYRTISHSTYNRELNRGGGKSGSGSAAALDTASGPDPKPKPNDPEEKIQRSPILPKRTFVPWSPLNDPGTPGSAYRSLPDESPPKPPSQFLWSRFGLRRGPISHSFKSKEHQQRLSIRSLSSRGHQSESPTSQYASDPEPSSHFRSRMEQQEEVRSQHRRMMPRSPPSKHNNNHNSIRCSVAGSRGGEEKDMALDPNDDGSPRVTTLTTTTPAARTLEETLQRHALTVPSCFQTDHSDDQQSETIVFSTESDIVEVIPRSVGFGGGNSVRDDYTKKDDNDEEDGDDDSFAQLMTRNQSTSELHSLCETMTSIDDVTRAKTFFIGSFIDDVSRTDYKGETPLHAFANNKQLSAVIENPKNVEFETKDYLTLYRQPTFDQNTANQLHASVVKFLVDDLLPCYPAAMALRDHRSFIPFEAGLVDWIASCETPPLGSPLYRNDNTSYFSVCTRKAVSQVWETTSSTIINAAKFGGRTMSIIGSEIGPSSQRHSSVVNDSNDVEMGRCNLNIHTINDGLRESSSASMTSTKELAKDAPSPMEMYILTPHARFCLEMLSIVVDELQKYSNASSSKHHTYDHGNDTKREKFNRAIRGIRAFQDKWGHDVDLLDTVIHAVASIPNLLQTILFIHDEADLDFVLSTSIIRRVMVQKQSIGKWLTTMLQNPNKETSQRAIEYLDAVSKLCSGDDSLGENLRRKNSGGDEDSYSCRGLVDEVSRLQDFIPSLLSLGDHGIEQASTTLIVRKVLNRLISKPFAATVVICDAIFLALMLGGFRSAVNQMIKGASFDVVLKSIYIANVGIFYYVITEIGKACSLLQITKNTRRYFVSFWNLIDLSATALALASSVCIRWKFDEGLDNNEYLRGLFAVTTMFLWMRVLSFLKHINLQLATFILAIIQITKDILWFALILLVLVVCVSQMFLTLLAPSSCASGDVSDQCKLSYFLLQSYQILMGEFQFDHEAFSAATWFSVFVVVLYSFLVTVVLLNVLIAVASDSYEKSQLKSQKLFGRSRVYLVAQLASFNSLLRKRDDDLSDCEAKTSVYSQWWTSTRFTNKWSKGSVLFFTLSLLVVILWTFAEVGGFLYGDQHVSILLSLSSVIVNAGLFAGIVIFLDRHASVVSQDKKHLVDEEKSHGWRTSFLQRAVHRLLGATPSGGTPKRRVHDDWSGRVHFLQHEMNRHNNNTRELILKQSKTVKALVHETQSHLQSEVSNMESRFRHLETTLAQTNMTVAEAVSELKALISIAGSSGGHRSPVPSEVDIRVCPTPLRSSFDRHDNR